MNNPDTLQIGIARIYLKDLSFESPSAPALFTRNWRPEINLEVDVRSQPVQEGLYEVSLELTVQAKEGDQIAFIVEVEQAGLFEIRGADEEQVARVLRIFCPSTLFPYARQAVDHALTQGSFPPLMLAPINFEALAEKK